jgi:CheY-like chemotaxis protein
MGGSIRAESTKGRGSEFIIEIDRKYGRPQKIKRSEKDAGGSLIGRRILLCEDNQINTVVAVKLLEKMGCKVDCEANGKLGLERFAGSKVNTYDAILMDIRMPEMDGLEATERIRALGRPESATIPIIAMSANAFEEDIRKSLNAGMNAHLSKPIDVDALYRELAKRLK